MEAIVILAIFGGYLAVAVFTVRAVVGWHAKHGATKTQRWLWGGAVALAFYLVPFWDWVPTILAHKRLCDTEGKLLVNKTLEQWKAENQDAIAALRYDHYAKGAKVGGYYRFPLNQRLALESSNPVEVLLSIRRQEIRVVDTKSGEVLAKSFDFFAPRSEKFWLETGRCKERRDYELLAQEIKQLGGAK